ncbi:MAG: FtsW/RodA/SpoVE family cell cycle protein [Patescibacteria group bacterium]
MTLKKIKSYPKNNSRPDYPLFFLLCLLLIFGVLMVYNASVVYSTNVFGGKYYFLLLQGLWVLLGLVALTVAANFDYHHYLSLAKPLAILTFILLIFLAWPNFPVLNRFAPTPLYHLLTPQTTELRVYRWIIVNPSPLPPLPFLGRFNFQPTDMAKITLVIFLAAWLSRLKGDLQYRRGKRDWHTFKIFLKFFIFFGVTALLTVLEPDFGTAVILSSCLLLVYFFAESPLWSLFLTVGLSFLSGIFFILTSEYRRERLMTYLSHSGSDPLSTGYHLQQVLIALGSGGLTGLGLGQSRQKYEYLPEVATDSIFAVVGEELGLLGTVAVILIFVGLIYRCIDVSKKAPDEFGRLLSGGLTAWLAIQFFVNIAAMTGILPLTGVPLPFISYGGSSMVTSLISVGIILNISRQAVRPTSPDIRR